MAVTRTAKRAIRQAVGRKVLNDARKKKLKEALKTTKAHLVKKDSKVSRESLKNTFQAIDKAVKRGVIKKGNANRKKSRLAKAINKLEK